jgi:hypothetical protein
MIQRIQTLWLLLAFACSIATLFLPFYSGNKENDLYAELNAQSHFLLLLLCVAVMLSSLLSVFFYKNRKKQMVIVIVGIALQVLNIIFFLNQTKFFVQGAISFSALFTFFIPVLFVLAFIGIRKDEKLIQNMDRLR